MKTIIAIIAISLSSCSTSSPMAPDTQTTTILTTNIVIVTNIQAPAPSGPSYVRLAHIGQENYGAIVRCIEFGTTNALFYYDCPTNHGVSQYGATSKTMISFYLYWYGWPIPFWSEQSHGYEITPGHRYMVLSKYGQWILSNETLGTSVGFSI